jgi:hypothetical protein
MAKNEIDFSPTNPENRAAGAPQEEEEVTDDTPEVVVGEEEEEKPPAEVVTLTPEEFAALKAQSDSAGALKAGLEGLASKLQPSQTVIQQPANAPQQTAEEFYAEHSDDMFDKEKGPALMKKFMKLASEQEYGGMLRGLSTTLAKTRGELLEAKDPHFKKYKAEVEALIAAQPADVQMAPDIVEKAWFTVRQRHQVEIEEETISTKVASKVDELVNEKLKALGLDPEKVKAAGGVRPAAHVNSEGRSTPSISGGGSGGKTKIRYPDEKTRQEVEAYALKKGLDVETVAARRGYVVKG